MEHGGVSKCFRCGEFGHWADNCHLLNPTVSEREHMDRIARFVDRWADGEITIEQKRVAISVENQMWHGDKCPDRLKYP